MRVPISSSESNQYYSPNLKFNIRNNTTNTSQNLSVQLHSPTSINPYEPTSVLDLCRSPSPRSVPEIPTEHSSVPDSLELDDHVLHNLDWDSIMKDLGLHDDIIIKPNECKPHVTCLPEFSPEPAFEHAADLSISEHYSNPGVDFNCDTFDHLLHDFNQSVGSWNNGFDFIEELIRAADCFDTNQPQLAQVILERLNQRLRLPVGKPLLRAAFYFKEALQSLHSSSNRTPRISSLVDIVETIKTFKAFSGISPIPMFSIFTTNQALLEAFHGTPFMHVIDFDVGLGIQYASLMKEIAEKAETCKPNSPVLRITAVVPEEYAVESKLIRENLNLFAHELRIRVQVEFVPFRTFETLSFKAVKFMDREKTAVLLSATIFRRLGTTNNMAAFLGDVRRVSPNVVVFVDSEEWTEAAGAKSFRRSVVDSLEYYSMMFESLDASMMGGGGEWIGRIEMLLLRPKILAAVKGAGQPVSPWREMFYGVGLRPVQLSQSADSQAECLLTKFQIRGFQLAKRQAELVLFWHERAMVSTSAWQC